MNDDKEEGENTLGENLVIATLVLFAIIGFCFCFRWVIDWKFQHDIDAGRNHSMMQMLNLCLVPKAELRWFADNTYQAIPAAPVTFEEFRDCMTQTIE